jgi:hypothetical protein
MTLFSVPFPLTLSVLVGAAEVRGESEVTGRYDDSLIMWDSCKGEPSQAAVANEVGGVQARTSCCFAVLLDQRYAVSHVAPPLLSAGWPNLMVPHADGCPHTLLAARLTPMKMRVALDIGSAHR